MTRRPVRFRALMSMAGAAAAIAAAPQRPPAFRAETRLVVLHATVSTHRGELVTNLDKEAFTIYEDGKRQSIALFRRDDIPVSMGLIIDNSGSMRTLRAGVEAAALAFVRASNPDDDVFVINFADHPRLDVPMTRDPSALAAGIARVDSIGGTALRDAVDMAERYLRDHATRDRRALLIVTDGNDNASETTMQQIRDDTERSETAIYAIGLFKADSAASKPGRKALEALTAPSGGLTRYPASVDEIAPAVIELAHQLRQQYTLGYTSTNQAPDSSYHRIRVEAKGSSPLTVRTRTGYRAPMPATPQ